MEAILKYTTKDFSQTSEKVQTIIIAVLSLGIPTFLAQLIETIFGPQNIVTTNSQLIVGSVVNTLLIICALNVKGFSKTAFIITMPSVSTILSGYVFKSASVYMVWMIPAIWLGNFALIFAFKYIMLSKGRNYILAAISGVICKVLIIFGFFTILKLFNVFPDKLILNLQKAMTLTQLITAIIGCIIAYIFYKIEYIHCTNI